MDAPLYVVIASNDKAHPRWGKDPGGPLILEQYTKDCATREQAEARAAEWERRGFGACRVARLVFDEDPPTPTGAPAP